MMGVSSAECIILSGLIGVEGGLTGSGAMDVADSVNPGVVEMSLMEEVIEVAERDGGGTSESGISARLVKQDSTSFDLTRLSLTDRDEADASEGVLVICDKFGLEVDLSLALRSRMRWLNVAGG